MTAHLSFNKLPPQKGAPETLLKSKICQGIDPRVARCPPMILALGANFAFPQAKNVMKKCFKAEESDFNFQTDICKYRNYPHFGQSASFSSTLKTMAVNEIGDYGNNGRYLYLVVTSSLLYLYVFVGQSDTSMCESFQHRY